MRIYLWTALRIRDLRMRALRVMVFSGFLDADTLGTSFADSFDIAQDR